MVASMCLFGQWVRPREKWRTRRIQHRRGRVAAHSGQVVGGVQGGGRLVLMAEQSLRGGVLFAVPIPSASGSLSAWLCHCTGDWRRGGRGGRSVWRRLWDRRCQKLSSCEVYWRFRELERGHMVHFLSNYQGNTYCPPETLSPKSVCMCSRRVSHLTEPPPPSISGCLCLSCVENSKAWGSYNEGLLTGTHCCRNATKCPLLGLWWWGEKGNSTGRGQDVIKVLPYFKSSRKVLRHELQNRPYELVLWFIYFIHDWPLTEKFLHHPIRDNRGEAEPLIAFTQMHSLVRTFSHKLNYSSSWQETTIPF